jgi:predicted transcriptional regulator
MIEILRTCNQNSHGAEATILCERCGLSGTQRGKLAAFLERFGFITITKELRRNRAGNVESMTIWKTTAKGIVLLLALENVECLLKDFEEFILTAPIPLKEVKQ